MKNEIHKFYSVIINDNTDLCPLQAEISSGYLSNGPIFFSAM